MDQLTRVREWPFLHARPAIRCVVLLEGAAAVALALRGGLGDLQRVDLAALLALMALAVLDTELGRRAEGARLVGQRPNKGLSAWPFAAVLLVPVPAAALIALPVYVYVRQRGMCVPLWKWVGSAMILVLAAQGAQLSLGDADPASWRMLLAIAVFLAVEAAGFWSCALSGEPADEEWLKAQLRSRSFYLAELAVLCQASVLVVLWTVAPWLVLLLVPTYAVLQRALLHAPLQQAAEIDSKTGVWRWGAWEERAKQALAGDEQFCVVLLDLDLFKNVNDTYGHLTGDAVLSATAAALKGSLRPVDLLGRFGGEEFCVLVPGSDVVHGVAVGERLRTAVSDARCPEHPGVRVTASVGVYASAPCSPEELREAIARADVALYAAKTAGRDCVRSYRPPVVVPAQATRQVVS